MAFMAEMDGMANTLSPYGTFEHMIERPDEIYGQDIGSNYQAQGLKLSKHFVM